MGGATAGEAGADGGRDLAGGQKRGLPRSKSADSGLAQYAGSYDNSGFWTPARQAVPWRWVTPAPGFAVKRRA